MWQSMQVPALAVALWKASFAAVFIGAVAVFAAGLEGMTWTTATVVALLGGAILLSQPLLRVVSDVLDRFPPHRALAIEEAARSIDATLSDRPDLEALAQALSPLQAALARGALALVSFDPDRTLIVRDDGHELRSAGHGAALVQLVTGALLLIVITIEFLAGRLTLGNTVFGRAVPKAGARRPAAGSG